MIWQQEIKHTNKVYGGHEDQVLIKDLRSKEHDLRSDIYYISADIND